MADGRQIHARDHRAAAREPDEVGAGATSHFQHRPAAIPVEADQPRQVVELLEVILVEIGEEPRRSDRVLRDLQIMNVLVPVVADSRVRWGRMKGHAS